MKEADARFKILQKCKRLYGADSASDKLIRKVEALRQPRGRDAWIERR